MTVSATNIEDLYVGNGSSLNFPITFNLKDNSTIQVLVDGVLQSLGGSYNFDSALNPTEVIFSTAPAAATNIEIRRVSPLTQTTDLNENETYSSRAESIEDEFDRLLHIAQEQAARLQELEAAAPTSTVTSSGPAFPDWSINTPYVRGNGVKEGGVTYLCLLNHTSDNSNFLTDLGLNRWERFNEGEQGIQGQTGAQGPTGPSGTNGLPGAAGANGNDGIFSEIANTAEAQAGTDDSKGMTPLKTAQAIASQVPSLPVVTGLQTSMSALSSSVGELGTRLSAVENSLRMNLGRFSGSQQLDNNVTTAIDLLGSNFGATGVGAQLSVDDTGAEFANIQLYIRRTTDGNTVRFSSFKINMHFVNGTWYMMREETFVLEESLEVDGVMLMINTDANGVGQVSYTSDDVGGVYDPKQSYIAWVGQEITKGSLPC